VIDLDENVYEDQRAKLRQWGVHLVHIGHDVGRQGMQDGVIIPFLRSMRRPTFVSRDADFFDKSLCSDGYCLMWLDVRPVEVAVYVRRLLRHPDFRTWSQRRGLVLRVAENGITVWTVDEARPRRHKWSD
jgi:hypothetical protein